MCQGLAVADKPLGVSSREKGYNEGTMPAPKCDGGKDSWHGGKERVIQAAKPLGTEAEGLPFAAVLLAVGSVYDGGGVCLRWRRASAN